jgi:hypothetical protein
MCKKYNQANLLAMKYKCMLSIFIPFGILVSVPNQESTLMPSMPSARPPASAIGSQEPYGKKVLAGATSTTQTAHLPNYVKFNPHGVSAKIQANNPPCSQTPTITVQLIPIKNTNEAYIEYTITDCVGIKGKSHSRNSHNNESNSSTLFTKTFMLNKGIDLEETANPPGEVTIKVTGMDGKCYEWESDSKPYSGANQQDSDVRWKPIVPCD